MKLAVLCSCNVEVLVHAVQKALCMPVCAAYKAPGFCGPTLPCLA